VTVALRDATRSDDAWLDGWLPAVAASVGYEVTEPKGRATVRSSDRLIIERDAEPVGIVIWRTCPRDAAIIELIATPTVHARHGCGMLAAALLEERLRTQGVRTIFAPASAVHGIAMYFWIRLGYRPLLRGDWPCARDGVAWLVRRLDT
jgi:hypothetical protein